MDQRVPSDTGPGYLHPNGYLKRLRAQWSPDGWYNSSRNYISRHNIAYTQFTDHLWKWQRNPWPVPELYDEVLPLFKHDRDLLEGFREFLVDVYPDEVATANIKQAAEDKEHRQACSAQNSALLKLPREIRDNIWKETISGNIVHISHNPNIPFNRRKTKVPKFLLHRCVAASGLSSLVTPPGLGEHAHCMTTGRSDYGAISLVCKQILVEIPNVVDALYSQNALQFPDLLTAENFLFFISEDDREQISHLRLSVPYELSRNSYPETRYIYQMVPHTSWEAILNYFSNPWDRKMLGCYPCPTDKDRVKRLKTPVYLHYTEDYYNHPQNRHLLHTNWRIGCSGNSRDVDISSLKYKGLPRLDISMAYPLTKESDLLIISDGNDITNFEQFRLWEPNFSDTNSWILPLLQFKQYTGLTFRFYDPDTAKETSTSWLSVWVQELKEHLEGLKIGPSICPFFSSGRFCYGNGEQEYVKALERY